MEDLYSIVLPVPTFDLLPYLGMGRCFPSDTEGLGRRFLSSLVLAENEKGIAPGVLRLSTSSLVFPSPLHTPAEIPFGIHSLPRTPIFIHSRCTASICSFCILNSSVRTYHYYVSYSIRCVPGFLSIPSCFSATRMVGSRNSNKVSHTTSNGKPEYYRRQS